MTDWPGTSTACCGEIGGLLGRGVRFQVGGRCAQDHGRPTEGRAHQLLASWRAILNQHIPLLAGLVGQDADHLDFQRDIRVALEEARQ